MRNARATRLKSGMAQLMRPSDVNPILTSNPISLVSVGGNGNRQDVQKGNRIEIMRHSLLTLS